MGTAGMTPRWWGCLLVSACLLGTVLPAWAQSTSFLWWSPGPPARVRSVTGPAADVMHCRLRKETIGITSVTQAAYVTGATPGTGTMGVSFWSSDGQTRLGAATVAIPAATTAGVWTGLSFSLTKGTSYWLCWCASISSTTYRGNGPAPTVTGPMLNHTATRQATASPGCSAGAPPAGPISFTPATTGMEQMHVLLGTATP